MPQWSRYAYYHSERERITLKGSPLLQCHLGSNYIEPHGEIVMNLHFESGVIKLQTKSSYMLTINMKRAVVCLLIPSVPVIQSSTADITSLNAISLAERVKKRKKRNNLSKLY